MVLVIIYTYRHNFIITHMDESCINRYAHVQINMLTRRNYIETNTYTSAYTTNHFENWFLVLEFIFKFSLFHFLISLLFWTVFNCKIVLRKPINVQEFLNEEFYKSVTSIFFCWVGQTVCLGENKKFVFLWEINTVRVATR